MVGALASYEAERSGGRQPLFSILLPSRNRLDLLRHAVNTILRQDFESLEVIIADNASEEDYSGYVASLKDARVRLIRSETPLHVTDNWNRALDASRGSHIIMLGDDDGLTPGYLVHAKELIERFASPDALYVMAYHYAYPNTIPEKPAGYLVSVHYDAMGFDVHEPLRMDSARAMILGRQALSLRCLFGFNSQHFVWRREFVDRLRPLGPFFQSPYPDFYSSFMTMLTAQEIIVDPEPRTIIGISPRSFGFHFANQRIEAGNAMLMLDDTIAERVRDDSDEVGRALAFPGSSHFRNWFAAAVLVARNLQMQEKLRVDISRYRKIQIYAALFDRTMNRAQGRATFAHMRPLLDSGEREFAATSLRLLRRVRRLPVGSARDSLASLDRVLGVHVHPRVRHQELRSHKDLGDVWNFLAEKRTHARRHADTLLRRVRRRLSAALGLSSGAQRGAR